MYPRPDGGLWLSARDEDLFEFKDGTIRPPPLEAHGVKSILTDRAGRLWIGSKTGLSWWTASGRRTFGVADGMARDGDPGAGGGTGRGGVVRGGRRDALPLRAGPFAGVPRQ